MRSFITILPVILLTVAACSSSDSDTSPATGGTGGSSTGGSAGSATGGSGGSATGGSAGSATGGSAGSATGGSAGSAGDARAQAAALATDNIPCTQDSDCCVAFDLCQNAGYVVGASDQAEAAALLDGAPQDSCTACIPPAIQVSCGANGFCTGAVVECTSTLFQEGMQNHCGTLTLPAECSIKTQSLPPSLPGYAPRVILTCGS